MSWNTWVIPGSVFGVILGSLRGTYEMLGINLRSAVCKAGTLILFWPTWRNSGGVWSLVRVLLSWLLWSAGKKFLLAWEKSQWLRFFLHMSWHFWEIKTGMVEGFMGSWQRKRGKFLFNHHCFPEVSVKVWKWCSYLRFPPLPSYPSIPLSPVPHLLHFPFPNSLLYFSSTFSLPIFLSLDTPTPFTFPFASNPIGSRFYLEI